MKGIVGATMFMSALVVCLLDCSFGVISSYQWENGYGSYWTLAEKASTIDAKMERIDQFITRLESAGLGGMHYALFLETPDNSFDSNLAALKTLQTRLHEIRGMDPNSFQYQTAIQQITQQEQGEAGPMINVLAGCWQKRNFPLLWGWVGIWNVVITIAVGLVGVAILADDSY